MKINEMHMACPECGGPAFTDMLLAEKKDACYYKVKASAKVWPSAYASGRLVQCRKKGAANYGKSKNEGVAEAQDDSVDLEPALRNLTGEFNKLMKHDDRMKTDPAYAKKWNKRYAKYAGNNDHDMYDDPIDDEQDVAEGSTSHAELAKLAHDAYVAASRKGNGPMAAHYLKQYLKHKADATKDKKGVEEGQLDSSRIIRQLAGPEVPIYNDKKGHGQRQYNVVGWTLDNYKAAQKALAKAGYQTKIIGPFQDSGNLSTYRIRILPTESMAEGHADQQRQIVKKAGQPVGEVGIDRESSPGVGQWYMKHYASGKDLGGYDSMAEALEELKHLVNQVKEAGSPAQQAAIAIAMKKAGKKPMNEYNAEYDDEAGMADNNLETLRRAVDGLDDLISAGDNLPEWCQEKIAVAKSMLVNVWDYMASEEERGADPEVEEMYEAMEQLVAEMARKHGTSTDLVWEQFEALPDRVLFETAAWRRKEGKSAKGGLNRKGVASYRREHPGSKLQMAVTTKPSKLKKGSKAAKRRKSFCARMSGVKGPMKKPNGKPTRKALALRKWNC